MNITNHPLSAFVLGLAFGLQKISQIVPNSPNLEAFLFDFNHKDAQRYVRNLMSFVQKTQADSWFVDCVEQYNQERSQHHLMLLDNSESMFRVVKKLHPEDIFTASIIHSPHLLMAEEIYTRHCVGYMKQIRALRQNNPYLGSEHEIGILFIEKSD